jgi:hypothetical protein
MLSTTGKTIGLACTIAAALAVSIAPAASAKGGTGTRIAGACSASSTSHLKVKQDDGRLQVEFEVDQNRNGVPWNVTLLRNGSTVFAGTRTTSAPSGSFSVERKVAGGTSAVISARATRNGETCTARLKVAAATIAAPAATPATTAAPGVKLRGDGTVDDSPSASATAADDHGANSGSGAANSGSGRNGGDDGADDHGHHGSDD